MIERLFEVGGQSALASVQTILLCLLSAYVLSQLVAWLYIWTHRAVSYSAGLPQSIVVLSLIVALLMLVVGSSVARAFGLFGALSLIRFRTPIKDARDTVYLFFSVAVGIAAGTQNLGAAVAGTVVICGILVSMHWTRFGQRMDHDALLRLRCEPGGDAESAVREILGRFCDAFSLLHMRAAGTDESQTAMEYAWQLRLYHSELGSRMSGELAGIDGVSHLSLLMQTEDAQP